MVCNSFYFKLLKFVTLNILNTCNFVTVCILNSVYKIKKRYLNYNKYLLLTFKEYNICEFYCIIQEEFG